MVAARIDKCVFGAYDTKGGAVSLGYRLNDDPRLNHRFSLLGGIKHFECSKLLSQFFRERRGGYLAKN
jgi:tRNA(adenine34) deaminase